MYGMNGGCSTIQSSFPMKNVSQKNRKKIPFNRFSSTFHENDRTVSGNPILVTDYLENAS